VADRQRPLRAALWAPVGRAAGEGGTWWWYGRNPLPSGGGLGSHPGRGFVATEFQNGTRGYQTLRHTAPSLRYRLETSLQTTHRVRGTCEGFLRGAEWLSLRTLGPSRRPKDYLSGLSASPKRYRATGQVLIGFRGVGGSPRRRVRRWVGVEAAAVRGRSGVRPPLDAGGGPQKRVLSRGVGWSRRGRDLQRSGLGVDVW